MFDRAAASLRRMPPSLAPIALLAGLVVAGPVAGTETAFETASTPTSASIPAKSRMPMPQPMPQPLPPRAPAGSVGPVATGTTRPAVGKPVANQTTGIIIVGGKPAAPTSATTSGR